MTYKFAFWSLAALACLAVSARAASPAVDRFGGWLNVTGHNTSGYFRTEKINGRYWLVTPDNHGFWSVGLIWARYANSYLNTNGVLGYAPLDLTNQVKYGSAAAWGTALRGRMQAWGFNTLSAECEAVSGLSETTGLLTIMKDATTLGCRMIQPDFFADVFDPKFTTACDASARTLTANATNPFTIGIYPDNELIWFKPPGSHKTLPDAFIALPAAAYGKQFWVNSVLKSKYATIAALNTAWGTSLTNWTGTGNTVINLTSLPDDAARPARQEDKLLFMEAIADRYYSQVTTAIRKYDKNHLIFSDRFANFACNDAAMRPYMLRVWKKAGQYCDMIAQNGYMEYGETESLNQFFSQQFAASGKPFLLTEHNYMANDADHYGEFFMATQMDRATAYDRQIAQLVDAGVTRDPKDGLAAKTCLGIHWFTTYDEPALGTPSGQKWQSGLINEHDEAYLPLVDVMSTVHRRAAGLLTNQSAPAVLSAPTLTGTGAAQAPLATAYSSKMRIMPAATDRTLLHSVGSAVADTAARGGFAWRAAAGVAANSYLQLGPYLKAGELRPGLTHRATFRLKTAVRSASVVAKLEVTSNMGLTKHVTRDVKGTDFTTAGAYQAITLSWTTPATGLPDKWEFRVATTGVAEITLDTTYVDAPSRDTFMAGALSDELPATQWNSQRNTVAAAAEFVAADLGAVRSGVSCLQVWPGNALATGMPVDFQLIASNDGKAWSLVAGQSYMGFKNTNTLATFQFAPISARFVGINITKQGSDGFGGYYTQLAELRVPALVTTARPTLSWTAVPGATQYTVLLSPEPSFPEGVSLRQTVSGTSCQPAQTLPQGTWFWTVRAVDAAGNGGHYAPAGRIEIAPAAALTPALSRNLNGEQLEQWRNTGPADLLGAGTGTAMQDPALRIEGTASTRLTYTINSYLKATQSKNPGLAEVPVRVACTPASNLTSISEFVFQVYAQPFMLPTGTAVSPLKYLKLRMRNSAGVIVFDKAIDPTGTMTAGRWQTVRMPLGTISRSAISEIAFYIDASKPELAWDERMVFNIDGWSSPGINLLQAEESPAAARDWAAYE